MSRRRYLSGYDLRELNPLRAGRGASGAGPESWTGPAFGEGTTR